MKKTFLALAFFSVTAFTLVSCGGKSTEKAPEQQPVQQASLYQCPMQCEGEKTYDKPGKCPVCGMDLQPVEAKTPADSAAAKSDSTRAV